MMDEERIEYLVELRMWQMLVGKNV